MTAREVLPFFIREVTRFVSPTAVAIEWVIVLLAIGVVTLLPSSTTSRLRKLRNGFVSFSRHKRLAILGSAVLPIVLRLSLLGVIPPPDPSIHDEFSHLLLGDTLAHGRLANPTHPMWRHFETIHVIQQPTYASMYPPVQGMFLGLGEKLFGDPWAGVLISLSLMCAAVCWMMQGWMPPQWALFGTVLLILKLCVNGLWVNSYLGGAGASIGGALLIGSLPRLRKSPFRAPAGALAALGVVILANTRPFDGGILSFAVLLCCAPAILRGLRRSRANTFGSLLAPATAVLLCGGILTGYYCWRVTGHPLRMPYQVNRDTYGWPENLAFLPVKKVQFRHKALADMYVKEVEHRQIYRDAKTLLDNLTTRAFDNWTYLIGPVLTVPLLFLPWALRRKRARPLLLFVGLILFLNLFQMVLYPYHLAAIVPCIFALATIGFRYIYLILRRRNAGIAWNSAVVICFCLIMVGAMKQEARALELPLAYWEITAEPHRDARAALNDWLSARSRKQLVIVRYSLNHTPNQEWVFNDADIDNSKVVWAREMDDASNKRLMKYFKDREAWLLEADAWPTRVIPYKLSD